MELSAQGRWVIQVLNSTDITKKPRKNDSTQKCSNVEQTHRSFSICLILHLWKGIKCYKPSHFTSLRSLTFNTYRNSSRRTKNLMALDPSIRICQKAQLICVTMYHSFRAPPHHICRNKSMQFWQIASFQASLQ